MAIYNEILSGRYSRFVQRLFSMKGEQATKQVSGEIIPVQNLPFGVEHRFLLQDNRFGAAISITGAAAQFCGFRLRNPAKSGVIAVIESVFLSTTAAQNFNADISGPVAADLALSVFAERLDGRLGSATNRSAMSLSDQTTLVSGVIASMFVGLIQNGVTFQLITNENQELTVTPGDAFTIGNQTAATVMQLAIIWRERILEESEAN